MSESLLGIYPRLKVDLMFEGLRYSEALGAAACHSFPNYSPYRFASDETNPTGLPKVDIPYLLTMEDGSLIRIKPEPGSGWTVTGSRQAGYRLVNRVRPEDSFSVQFEPMPGWMSGLTSDGFPMARCGVSLHGDMAVVNVAPGCEYFSVKNEKGKALRCSFCHYGAPDLRTKDLGQVKGTTRIASLTLKRLQETLQAALAEGGVRHIYLVGGCLTDPSEEGYRYFELAEAVQAVNQHRVPVACGSGALPEELLLLLRSRKLVDSVCFNLEVWSEDLFASVCPGKQRFVGYQNWLKSLEFAVELWGPGRVYTAMVAGVEMEPEHGGLSEAAAADLALEGADSLAVRGIIPIYSLYWPSTGQDHPARLMSLRSYFERLTTGYREIRRRRGIRIWDGFMCHRCAYMQLECDLDRLA